MYGSPTPTVGGGAVFLVINTMKSLADTDKSMKDSEKFASELGAAGMQKVSEFTAASLEATSTNLFATQSSYQQPAQRMGQKGSRLLESAITPPAPGLVNPGRVNSSSWSLEFQRNVVPRNWQPLPGENKYPPRPQTFGPPI
jgi:hypothetical protein